MLNSQELANLIKATAKSKNIAVGKMLSECNLGINTLSSMQSGGYFPRLEAITKIADYLDVSIDYLLGRTDNPEINRDSENIHIIKIAARNGSSKELALSDEQLNELERYIDSLPEFTDL